MSQQEQKVEDQISQKKDQIINEAREEVRNKEVNETLNKKREELLNKENPEQSQENLDKQEEQDQEQPGNEEELEFEEIQSDLRKIIDELGDDLSKIQKACEENRFVKEGKMSQQEQDKILLFVKEQKLNEYFWFILLKCNTLMYEMFKQMEKSQETDVELPQTYKEFSTILWQNLTAPKEDEEYEEEQEDEQNEEQN